MRGHGLCGEEVGEAPLYVYPLQGVGIVAAPKLGEVLQRLIIAACASARAEHHGHPGILRADALHHIVYAAHVVDIHIALPVFEIGRVNIGDGAVAVPLEVSHAGVFG